MFCGFYPPYRLPRGSSSTREVAVMLRVSRALARPAGAIAGLLVILAAGVPSRGAVTREDVERAIRDGLRSLKQEQRADCSWDDVSQQAKTGTTSLVTL